MTNTFRPPVLSDDELRETLDLLSTVMASVSDRVDAQTDVLGRLSKTVAEARQAAFAARAQTDPTRYGALVAETVDAEIKDSLVAIVEVAEHLKRQSVRTGAVLETAAQDHRDDLRRLAERERRAGRLKRALPWLGLGALSLAVAMTLLAPRILAGSETTCALVGGSWSNMTNGTACVFSGL